MKKLHIHSGRLAALSAALVPVLMLGDLSGPFGITFTSLTCNLLFATGVLLSVPPRCGSGRAELLATLGTGLLYIVLKAAILAAEWIAGKHLPLAVPLAVCSVEIPVLLKFYGWRVSRVMVLFKEWTPDAYFGDLTHVIIHMGFVVLSVFAGIVGSAGFLWAKITVLVLSGAVFVRQIVRAVIRRRPMLRSSVIIRLQKRFSEWRKDEEKKPSTVSQLHDVYLKAEEYMKLRKPYLAEGLTLEDMAERLYVNKTYLSRAVNTYSGKRFRQWLNTYRVLYSIELFKKGDHLKVSTLASLSGFKTPVTYTQAFQIVMGESPGVYFHRLKLEFPE